MRGGSGRVWREIRRNDYRWLFLVIAVGTGIALSDRTQRPVLFWSQVTLAWRDSLYILLPWTGAAAAWTAGRERRHGLDDLLLTTARSPFRRRLSQWAAVSLLGIAAFLLVGCWLLFLSASRASWARLDVNTIVVSLMAIPAFAALGFAWGAWQPRRAAAFAAMIVFAIVQLLLGQGSGWGNFLSATPQVSRSPWDGVSPDLSAQQFFFFLAVTALGLALLSRVSTTGWLVRGSLAAAGLLVFLAVAGIIDHDEQITAAMTTETAPDTAEFSAPLPGSYVPLCGGATVIVCVHPAFQPMLAEASAQFDALIGLMTAPAISPARIDLLPALPAMSRAGTWPHLLRAITAEDDLRDAVDDLAKALFAPVPAVDVTAQNTVLAWVLTASGRPLECSGTAAIDSGAAFAPVDCDAVAHLNSLDPAAAQAWLAANVSKLRDGSLTMEDLP